MTGISLQFELRDEEARRRLQEMLDRMDNRRPFLEAVGDRLVRAASDSFRNERAPDGTPWTPLAARTIQNRIRKGQVPLTILRSNTRIGSSLAGSINRVATNDEVRVGSPVAYAAIHQLGGTIRKPARQAKIYRLKDANGTVGLRFVKRETANHVTDVTIPAHSITIPARPFLGVSATDRAAIIEDAEDWLTR
ncbi:phage virion morphogenesis protein [Paracoccus spongiarum]|uniref:Phage virion morphogenesis protein n=1 Tax=Paracoccus spongiarum TaxID=3064387 RepID=A0ABT9JGI1_9RHOB|nr:phage virion morphogenesis protein [Paracoccus sp. 2205BS29-5]MDP5308730.1 phage virion morphogenesis protein [Paracoccus sp. 2205BS29-5]